VAVSFPATLNRPFVFIVVFPELFPETDHDTVCGGLFCPLIVAEKSCVVPVTTLTFLGFIDMLVITAPVTLTIAVPCFEWSATDLAVTVKVFAGSLIDTDSNPASFIDVPLSPPVTPQVTPCGGLLVPLTVTLNCLVCPRATLTGFGVTTILSIVGTSI
jgi:hypothetical protein